MRERVPGRRSRPFEEANRDGPLKTGWRRCWGWGGKDCASQCSAPKSEMRLLKRLSSLSGGTASSKWKNMMRPLKWIV